MYFMPGLHFQLRRVSDLTLFSYDGDETTAKAESSAQPEFAPEPVKDPPPAENVAASSDLNNYEPKVNEPKETPLKDENMYGNDHNGDSGPTWDGGQGNDGNSAQWNDTPMEEESRGIGIKEDG